MNYKQIESTTRSRKYYCINQKGERVAYIPLRDSSNLEENEATHGAGSPPAMSYSNSRRTQTSPTPPPTPRVDDMVAHMKLPTFRGVWNEDMDWLWFIADVV